MPTSAVEVPGEAVEAASMYLYGIKGDGASTATQITRGALAAALPAIEDSCRKRFEEELAGPAMDLTAAVLYSECPDCGQKEPERPACGCALCKDMAKRTKALRAALQATREGAGDER